MFDLVLLLIGCLCLYAGGEALIRGASAVGRRLSMSPLAVGLVFVGLGTSAPELAVSLDAAVQGHPELAAGNVVGSNILNASLGLAALAWLGRAAALPRLVARDVPILLVLTLLAAGLLLDGNLMRPDGLALMLGSIVFFVFVLRDHQPAAVDCGTTRRRESVLWPVITALCGIALLVAGAEAMVRSGVAIASALGVSQSVVALTVTSVGTGIPEIAATLVATLRGQSAIALGNIVGSNVLNLGLVLGLTGLVAPLAGTGSSPAPLFIMVAITALLWAVLACCGRRIRSWRRETEPQ